MFMALVDLSLAFVPLLLPAVLILSIVLLTVSALVLYSAGGQDNQSDETILRNLFHNGGFFNVFHWKKHEGFHANRLTRSASRAMRFSIAAALINFTLYSVLALQSWACYIFPLDRELEPTRDVFRKEDSARAGTANER